MEISNKLKNIGKGFVAIVAISVALSACSKRNDQPSIIAAGVSFINASPTVKEFDIYIGRDQLMADAFKYGTKSVYVALYPGTSTLRITERGKSTLLLTKDQTYQSGKRYSTFLIDTGANRSFLTVVDKLDSPATDTKAKVRFLNLSPDAPALSLAVTGATAPLFTNKLFKESTSFTDVEPGDNVSFDLKEADVVKATLAAGKLEKGKYYTIYAKGYKGKPDGDVLKFGANIFVAQ